MAPECVCVEAMPNATGPPQNATLLLFHHPVLHAMKASVNNPYLGVFQPECLGKVRVNVVLLQPAVQLTKQVIDVLNRIKQVCACVEKTRYVLLEARLGLV